MQELSKEEQLLIDFLSVDEFWEEKHITSEEAKFGYFMARFDFLSNDIDKLEQRLNELYNDDNCKNKDMFMSKYRGYNDNGEQFDIEYGDMVVTVNYKVDDNDNITSFNLDKSNVELLEFGNGFYHDFNGHLTLDTIFNLFESRNKISKDYEI